MIKSVPWPKAKGIILDMNALYTIIAHVDLLALYTSVRRVVSAKKWCDTVYTGAR